MFKPRALTEQGHVEVVQSSADQGLGEGLEEVDKALEDVQLKSTVHRHSTHEFFVAALRPCGERREEFQID